MAPNPRRLLRLSGFAVVAILLGLALYPGALTSPYVTAEDTPRYAHTIVPETSPLYEDNTDGFDNEVYRYEERSPVGRELFDRTRAADPRQQYNGERRFVPDVCRDFVIVCDTYSGDEMPGEFAYGTELSYGQAFVFVEDGDERYPLRTGITGHLFLAPFPVGFVLRWLTTLPLAIFVAVVTSRSGSDRALVVAVGGGALVAALGVLAPPLEMAGLVSTLPVGLILLGGVWLSITAAGRYGLYRRVAVSGRRGPPETP